MTREYIRPEVEETVLNMESVFAASGEVEEPDFEDGGVMSFRPGVLR